MRDVRTVRWLASVFLLMGCAGDSARPSAERPAKYDLGRVPTAAEIAALDIDVNSAGTGLSAGQGTAVVGAIVYAQKCALCHGEKGEGKEKNPRLVGRDPAPGFVFASDYKAPKTIGNYWPYATTLYDYIRRTMPFNAPGSLSADETYAVVAWLLAENGIITPTRSIDAKTLADVKMPAQAHFVPDNRTGGKTIR